MSRPQAINLSGATSRRRPGIALVVIILTVMMIGTQIAGFLFTTAQQRALIDVRNDTREMRIVQQALVDQKESIEDYLLTGSAAPLQSYYAASDILKEHRPTTLRRLDAANQGQAAGATLAAFDQLQAAWTRAVRMAHGSGRADAVSLIASEDARRMLTATRGAIVRYIERRNVEGEGYERRTAAGSQVVLFLQLAGGAFSLIGLLIAFRSTRIEAQGRKRAMNEAVLARQQVERLLDVTDMLQSASDYNDAKAVLHAAVHRLLPELSGCLYLYNNSRDRLDLLMDWGTHEGARAPTIPPSSCWALKRGKPHSNSNEAGALRCDHYEDGRVTLEVPMMARGEVHGLLCFSADEPDAKGRLEAAQSLITALADSMSLALAAISLREKLRNQALRDPLTGLYNRRYMEDMLQRFVGIAERNGTPVSMLMIDLDHFKQLNDEHGHMMGDNVLRSAAGAITGSLREEDVACRYGGEELAVLLPSCNLSEALRKAEMIRSRIEHLSELHGARVSASIGVASIPETSAGAVDLLAISDAALYQAKREGRNRVCAAGDRPGGDYADAAVRLSAAAE